ncbi:MAG: DUF4870 domain-containing protein [Candidatus Binataceae bacterium]
MDAETAKPQGQPVAALSYLLGFVTGIIFLFLEPYSKDDFVRFHARQSIAFSIGWIAVNIILSVFIAILPHVLAVVIAIILDLFNIAAAIFWVILMYKAYMGERYRIPELSNWADSMGL